ncbi:unnamed protein product [Schistosoma curassoni]|uniref:Uncharacterized protein n=1 Tax=Schistosoma curassoni TaxID=6186 RepID=A0A183JS11_9TREM|nr:unnamed protein product [Schistosoma curassoni]
MTFNAYHIIFINLSIWHWISNNISETIFLPSI